MIDPKDFIDALRYAGIEFVTGVPDSLLKDVCASITSEFSSKKHIIATNEGSAVGMAMGHYLSTGKPAMVYMQNSGLGNAVNPITSLAAGEVYGIPMVLMVGWRGEIDKNGVQLKDEPQHVKQGSITTHQLELLDIPYEIVTGNEDITTLMTKVTDLALKNSAPAAILVRKGSFSKYALNNNREDEHLLSREQVIEILVDMIPGDSPVVSTTGKTSRELYELRKARNEGHEKDFLTVGGMGHASQIAAGIALSRPEKTVYCLDGDGAVLMHMGALTINSGIKNLKHIVLNNGAHDSVGGQPTRAADLNLAEIAKECGYSLVLSVTAEDKIKSALEKIIRSIRSSFLEIRCRAGARKDLGRPDRSPKQNKQSFMDFLKS